MRARNLWISSVHFCFLIALFTLSALSFFIARHPDVRLSFLAWMKTESVWFYLGWVSLAVSLFLLTVLASLHGHRFYRVQMHRNLLEVDPALIQKYIDAFWKEYTPETTIESDVLIRGKNRIEIVAYLNSPKEDPFYSNLALIENRLGDLLLKRLGYQGEFIFTVIHA